MTKNAFSGLLAYLETLVLRGGDHDSEPFTVLPWELRFIRGAFSTDGDSALSVARGNGKSALVAAIACAVVDPLGPLHGTRREVVCCASSFQQGRVVFEDIREFLRGKYDLGNRKIWRLQDSSATATLEHLDSGARVRCTGSDPKRAHGLRPFLALCDEPSQWDQAKADAMLQAVRTGLGKVPGSKLIALGTRPADNGHWFARMLANASYAQCHAAPAEAGVFTMRAIKAANPSHGHLPSLRARLDIERKEARLDPAMLHGWQALRLNQGTADTAESVLLSVDALKAAERDIPGTGRMVWGIDTGSTASMSAVAAYWQSGRLEVLAALPCKPSLARRGLADGVGRAYQDMEAAGELLLLGENVSDVAALLIEARDRWGEPEAVAGDRWRKGEVLDAMDAARLDPRIPFEQRGQGFLDGNADLRLFRHRILDGKAWFPKSLLLRMALSEGRCVTDVAGNAKLAKDTQGGRRKRSRDDAAAAAIQAVAEGARRFAADVNLQPALKVYAW